MAISWFSPFKPPAIGIEFSEQYVEWVVLAGNGHVIDTQQIALPDVYFSQDIVQEPALLSELLISPLGRYKNAKVALGISSTATTYHRISLNSELTSEETDESMRFESMRLLDIKDEHIFFDYWNTNSNGNKNKNDYMLITCEPAVIQSQLAVFSPLKKDVSSLTINEYALTNLLTRQGKLQPEHAIICFGHEQANLIAPHNNQQPITIIQASINPDNLDSVISDLLVQAHIHIEKVWLTGLQSGDLDTQALQEKYQLVFEHYLPEQEPKITDNNILAYALAAEAMG